MKICLENSDVDDDLAENDENGDDDHSKRSRSVYLSAVSKISEQKYNTTKPKAGRIQDSLYLFLESQYGFWRQQTAMVKNYMDFPYKWPAPNSMPPLDTPQKLVMEDKDWHEDEALGSDGYHESEVIMNSEGS